MSDDDYDYLQPGFDPKALTVPRLRSILVAHDVQYPATAKKPQLIDLFNEGVVPKAKKFLDKQARAKRSSMGIIDVPRGDSSNSASFDEFDLAPPTSTRTTRRSRSPRKASSRYKSEEYDEQAIPPPVSPAKRTTRGSSRQLSHPPEDDFSRSTRRSTRTVTPQIKVEEQDNDVFFKRSRESENFSTENPFQSGSSPPTAPRPQSSRRKTAGDDTAHFREEDDKRRRTDGQSAYERPKSSRSTKSFEIPISKLAPSNDYEEFEVDSEDEVTPEEQLELEVEMASKDDGSIERRRAPERRGRPGFKSPLMALAVTLLGAYGAWYRQEKIAVGYCGLGRPAKEIFPPEVPVPDWALPFVQPQCEPCPQHAYCYEDFSVRCEPDFIYKPHPLAAGGLVPLPPTCEPDGEKVRRVKSVADRAVEELRERRAQYECGELVDESGQNEESPAMEEEQLREVISEKRSKKMSKQEFDDLWAAAIGEVKDREEVEVVEKANPPGISNTYLSSSSLARLSIGCTLKRSFRLGLERYRLPAGLLAGLVALYFYGRARYRSHRAEVAQVPALVDLVLSRLATQKELGEEEIDDPWLFLPNLRDDVLRSVHSLGHRDRIWSRVRAVVEQNSNVRTSQREGRSGEVGRAWEWIGPIAGESARRRRSGRVSWGPDVKGEETPEMSEKSGAHTSWEESRPIY